MKYCGLLLLCIGAFIGQSFGQVLDYASNKEKIYLHTSHVFLKPGDDVFFKLYLVSARDNTPSSVSTIAYVDVIGPSGNVVQQCTYPVQNGYAEGSYSFSPQAAGGVYKLRAYTSWMKNEKDSTFFVKELTLQRVISPRILMKLDFPQKGYGPGADVSADFSARDLSDKPIRHHTVKYTISIAGRELHSGNLQTDAAGKTKIQFRLPADLSVTDGLLNITIQYASYTEAISRSIPITLNKVGLGLMPEGGALVAGLPANVAFRALNEFGKPVDIKGELRDGHGNVVTTLESFHGGMGKFAFTPQAGNRYEVVLNSPAGITQRYELPKAAPKGLSLQMSMAGNELRMEIHSTQNADINITGSTKEQLYFTKKMRLRKGTQSITIDPQLFPAGIARFTVSQANGLPLAERVIFLNSRQMLYVSLTPDKNTYTPREKVTMTLKTTDDKGNPVPANLSLTVMDDKLWTFADDKQDHIISWLMMSSELRGKIDEPQFYFKKDEQKATAALDLVMLTHGYRYFDYLPQIERENKLKFFPDVQNVLTGSVVNDKDQPVSATVWLVESRTSKVMQLVTGPDGTFYYPNLLPGQYYYIVAQSLKKKERIKITISGNGIGGDQGNRDRYTVMRFGQADFFAAQPVKEEVVAPFAANDVKALQDVVVVGFGTQKKTALTGSVTTIAPQEYNFSSVRNMLAGRVPGIAVAQTANPAQGGQLNIRGTNTLVNNEGPLFVVDGIPMKKLDLGNLNPNDIQSLHILKDAAATSIYGSMANRGVIIIETKKNSQARIKWKHTPTLYYGFHPLQMNQPTFTPVRRFQAIQYETAYYVAERTDFRETIYWNPTVQTGKNGEASVSFYNSDATTTFRAIAEGIGFNGKVGREESTYAVQNMLGVDAKIPPYLTVGDNALIPLHIKNNYTQALEAVIKVSFVESVKAGIFNSTIQLPAGGSRVVYVPVTATSPVDGNLRFTVTTKVHAETVSLPVSVVQKGFPVLHTFAGIRSARHTFPVQKMIPGTFQYELKLFKNPEGQLLDGIAGMLREPYGCFEQTSSATYPNIFILKYLREAGRSDPKTEQRALELIAKGYQRLTGFETAEGGFEWFGKTPPHEALTAYGLMEFTDMNQFIAVDQQMLKRTRNFLLGRRNGKGGFHLSTTGYDRFASVPNKIADLYIVYAFSHAGFGAEVMREYEAVLAQVLQSGDAYRLSMMALTAANMKRQQDFDQLMALLRKHYRQKTFKSETSVVNSRAASLQVETKSLYLMALAREKSPDLVLMAELLSDIMAGKSYFGYSSTQATVLALNAVVDYARAVGKAAADTDIRFSLNNRTVEPGKPATTEAPAAENVFSADYVRPGNLPYNMEVSYYTFTPPNSSAAELQLHTALAARQVKTGETLRLQVAVKNEKPVLQAMSIAKIGIPAGLSTQPWQLKELMDKNQVAYYEIFDNYLVLYWMGFAPNETKTLHLDLKAEIPGTYKAKASNAGLYYNPEHKHWNDGLEATVMP
ncbi:TonB-dependent receptor plug domain-containing protein [Chitinophaga lutea]|nr:TonB-dependent receptor plug domain-containing protein [Chitinophaga lutea]